MWSGHGSFVQNSVSSSDIRLDETSAGVVLSEAPAEPQPGSPFFCPRDVIPLFSAPPPGLGSSTTRVLCGFFFIKALPITWLSHLCWQAWEPGSPGKKEVTMV